MKMHFKVKQLQTSTKSTLMTVNQKEKNTKFSVSPHLRSCVKAVDVHNNLFITILQFRRTGRKSNYIVCKMELVMFQLLITSQE